jgi:hypothetical protein
MTSLLNFIKIYQIIHKLTVGKTHTHTYTHRRDGDLISLYFSFGKESRLKVNITAIIWDSDLDQRSSNQWWTFEFESNNDFKNDMYTEWNGILSQAVHSVIPC